MPNMDFEIRYENIAECRTRFRGRYKKRGAQRTGGDGVRCIEKENVLSWNHRKGNNAREKGKLSIHMDNPYSKAGVLKWKHKKIRARTWRDSY